MQAKPEQVVLVLRGVQALRVLENEVNKLITCSRGSWEGLRLQARVILRVESKSSKGQVVRSVERRCQTDDMG